MEGDFPITKRVSAQTLALPFHNQLRREDVARVVAPLRGALGSAPS